jgi:molybdenum cofactor guanylyltransferase
MKQVAGIILAGGRSRRMGTDKAILLFGSETLLQRVARIVGQTASPVIVVAAQNQALPKLPSEVIVVRDENPDRGPLEALAAGLRHLQKSFPPIDSAFVTACDTPLLRPAFIHGIIELLDPAHDAAVPVLSDFPQPLVGVYRIKIVPVVNELLAAGQLSLQNLLKRIDVRFVAADQLREVDPDLLSLRNLNTPDDYQAALATAGLADDNRS